ncbi:hypothetical protein [Pseudomonas sp.]|uniref:hypothetical protein n=1 Tax=Pseudomonas sp. TaxID=306 RepID=UPI0026329769|nr:hypothetical protein [Pseudomonas sp.]
MRTLARIGDDEFVLLVLGPSLTTPNSPQWHNSPAQHPTPHSISHAAAEHRRLDGHPVQRRRTRLAERQAGLINRSFQVARLGCKSLQGYLLGHPLPDDQFIADIQKAAGEAMSSSPFAGTCQL